MFHTWHAGADCLSPRATAHSPQNATSVVWLARSPASEKEITAWFEAKNLDEEKAAIARLNKARSRTSSMRRPALPGYHRRGAQRLPVS